MSRAKIIDGTWSRHVPWEKGGEWRTDIFKTVLSDPRIKTARFVLKNGATVLIPASELKRVLVGGKSHYLDNKIWGPFNINPHNHTVNGEKVQMDVGPSK